MAVATSGIRFDATRSSSTVSQLRGSQNYARFTPVHSESTNNMSRGDSPSPPPNPPPSPSRNLGFADGTKFIASLLQTANKTLSSPAASSTREFQRRSFEDEGMWMDGSIFMF
ncbi:uncharacterized protein RSE6_10368 [Rhynchosporium secalis]|uniref:Uncharacterized protein n=1 Tax=Rhynchosporium secalis TaxID=38038 RepID=A0A1E1MK85_RHYSE|nr:uncharacterized protein RSE6_10368 [Rhynchosporium secalis]